MSYPSSSLFPPILTDRWAPLILDPPVIILRTRHVALIRVAEFDYSGRRRPWIC
jgi:hypothetical protein